LSEVVEWIPILETGFVVTIQLAAATACIAIVLSTILAILAISPNVVLRALATGYVEVFRSIPILALLIFFYYGLGPQLNTIGVSAFWLAVFGLSLIESAYLAEIYRGALQSISAAQWSAGLSLGLSWPAVLRLVILPQAMPAALPGTVNMMIAIIKDTSLASLVAVNEVTLAASELVSATFEPQPVYTLLGAFYLVLIVPFSLVGHLLERVVARALGLSARELTTLNDASTTLVGRVVGGLGGRWI
jgi:His/Glu/Gln/Arg/opine family amino acid ABC transporter permease subunit